jgi:hypothetical protein
MNSPIRQTFVPLLALLFAASPAAAWSGRQERAPASVPGMAGDVAKYAAPVRLRAGDKLLGAGRYYPSPVFRDIDDDGIPDVAVGDLTGRITFALRTSAKDPLAFSAETDLKGADGKPIRFHNW